MNWVVKKLKKYFIPHPENDHKPHLLRPASVAFVLLVAAVIESVFIFSASYVIPRSRLFGAIVVSTLIDGTNAARTADNLPPLKENALLDAAAEDKANDMVANDYFAHTSPSGLTPWYWFDKVGYDFASAGENLAVNFSDSEDVTNAWLASPEHRANILNQGFTEIGMATAQGTYNGSPAIYVVELFATPAPSFALGSAANAATVTAAPGGASAVRSAPTGSAAAAPAGTPSPAAPSQTNLAQTAAANPVRTINYLFLAIMVLFGAALALNVFVKIRIQYRSLILGGMLVILVVGLFIVLNQHFALSNTAVL